MKYDIEALTESLGPPNQRNEDDGIAWWYGSGRITVCLRADINHQAGVLFRNLPDDADVRNVIREIGMRIKLAAAEHSGTNGNH